MKVIGRLKRHVVCLKNIVSQWNISVFTSELGEIISNIRFINFNKQKRSLGQLQHYGAIKNFKFKDTDEFLNS